MPVPLLAVDVYMNQWQFGIVLCKLVYTFEGSFTHTKLIIVLIKGVNKSLSPLVLTALSVDRYIAVCRPSFYWLRQTKFALLLIGFCMVISLFFIAHININTQISMMELDSIKQVPKCMLNMSSVFDLLQAIICYALPFIFICSVYLAILRRLYQHTRNSTVGTGISLKRVVICSVLVVAFYFICWTPYWLLRVHNFLTTGNLICNN